MRIKMIIDKQIFTPVFYISKNVHAFDQNFDKIDVLFCLYKKPG